MVLDPWLFELIPQSVRGLDSLISTIDLIWTDYFGDKQLSLGLKKSLLFSVRDRAVVGCGAAP